MPKDRRNQHNRPTEYKSRSEMLTDIEKMVHYTRFLESRLDEIAVAAQNGNRLGIRAATLRRIEGVAKEHIALSATQNQPKQGE